MFRIPNNVKLIMNKLTVEGYQAYIVGGAVRDFLLGKEPHDFDITTDAHPDVILDLFKRYTLIKNGLKHGTVGVVINRKVYEVTTYRSDGEYMDHRHPLSVTFSKKLSDDLSRRDFTINALAYNQEVVDYYQGVDDLKKRIIRCVNNPISRFNEDALRILRALRFASVLEFEIEETTKQAIFKLYSNLSYISNERITVEISKMILGKGWTKVFKEFFFVFEFLFPKLVIENVDNAVKLYNKWDSEDLSIGLAILSNGFKDQSIINEHLKRLNFSTKIRNDVFGILKCEDNKILNKTDCRILLSVVSYDVAKKILLYKSIKDEQFDYSKYLKILNEIVENGECISLKQLKLNGNDLTKLSIDDKTTFKTILNDLLNKVIIEELPNNRDELIKYVVKCYKIDK